MQLSVVQFDVTRPFVASNLSEIDITTADGCSRLCTDYVPYVLPKFVSAMWPVACYWRPRPPALCSYLRRLRHQEDGRQLAFWGAAASADVEECSHLQVVSHELRAPLNGVIGLSEALMCGNCGPLSGKTKQFVTTIHSSSCLLLSL